MKKRTNAPKQRPIEAPVKVGPTPMVVRHACWAVPFALFLVLRLFSADSHYLLAGDQCTYLQLGRTFPRHQLFNHELYLLHPPLLGFVIGVFDLVLPLLTAGLVTTLLFACVNFFVVREIGRFDQLPRSAIFAGLVYLALSRPGVAYDYHVARISPLVCATALALLAFLHLLRKPSRKALLLAIAANVGCLMISDQAVLLLPCQAVLLWGRGAGGVGRKPLALLAGVSVAAVLIWPAVRWLAYSRRADLPAGIDGMIEFTKDFPLLALIQPNFLPFTDAHRALFTQTSLSLANLDLGLLVRLPLDLLLVPRAVTAVLVLGLAGAAFGRASSRRRALQWLLLTLLFLLPVGLGMNEWYGMGYILPFTLLLIEGAAALLAFVRTSETAVAAGLSAVCVLGGAMWLATDSREPANLLQPRGGAHFLFTRPPVTRGAGIAGFFASMPRDTGIMAPQGLSPEIVYLTDKRVVALPFDPKLLDPFVAKYRISYIVISNEYLVMYNNPRADLYTSRLVTDHIVRHPERYKPVQTQQETYPAFYPPMEYAVFQVQ
jgi:hypothetical protein